MPDIRGLIKIKGAKLSWLAKIVWHNKIKKCTIFINGKNPYMEA